MKKSISLLAMIATLSLFLCACGSAQPTPSDVPAQPQEVQTIPEPAETADDSDELDVPAPADEAKEEETCYLTIRYVDAETGEEVASSVTYPVPTIKPPVSSSSTSNTVERNELPEADANDSAQGSADAECAPYTYPETANGDPDWENMTDSEIVRCLNYLCQEPGTQFDLMHERLYFDLQGRVHGVENPDDGLYYATRTGVVYKVSDVRELPWNNTGSETANGSGDVNYPGVRVGETNRVLWVSESK